MFLEATPLVSGDVFHRANHVDVGPIPRRWCGQRTSCQRPVQIGLVPFTGRQIVHYQIKSYLAIG